MCIYIYIIWAHIYIHTFLFKTKQRAFWCWNRNLSVQGFLLPSSGEPESLPAITDKRKMGDQIWRDSFHFTYVSFYVPSYPKHWMYIVCMVYLHTFANLPLNYPKCRYVFPSHSWVSSYVFCSHMFQPSRRVPKWSRGIYFIQLPFVKENLCKNMMNWLMDVNGWTNPFGKYARQIRSWNLLRYFWNHLSNWKGTTSPLWKRFAIFCFPLHPFETAGKKNAWHDTHPHVFFRTGSEKTVRPKKLFPNPSIRMEVSISTSSDFFPHRVWESCVSWPFTMRKFSTHGSTRQFRRFLKNHMGCWIETRRKSMVDFNKPIPQLVFDRRRLSGCHPPYESGQIIILHQPRFPWNRGISLTKPPFGVKTRVRSL